MKRADLVTVGNDYLAARAKAAGARRVEWLPTVVDLDRYPVPAGKEASAETVIGWIGSPATAQYLHQLTPALAQVASRHAVRCVAIGARADQLEGTPFEAWIWCEDEEVDMLQRCDIGIMPLLDGHWERGKCGYKLIQYMACGLPVVASPVGVNADIVQPGVNGELAGITEEWVQILTGLVENAAIRQRMGEAGRESVEKTYSVQAQASRLANLLKNARPRNQP
ncbi:MAG: glycosyltransferase, partial [Xanthomonadaceae bacterium]|nr:glycosyltransferase [Xanthomonadaceae bacterium]